MNEWMDGWMDGWMELLVSRYSIQNIFQASQTKIKYKDAIPVKLFAVLILEFPYVYSDGWIE
ncbi:hypothetical protein DERF_014866 [Dermatophagoides farinae]|uniref:Uncharacterized protein n=1 Tax=Dermatophagoides farinae TaxID=6954 RepID=A0A922KXK3_DERFA|nr:hypothetical protein DERF_014866 [Dermatophagoides farinae]